MAANVEFRLSGGAANNNPNASLGGAMSSVSVNNSASPNLFGDADSAEALAGSTKYRCIYIAPTEDYTELSVWISTPTLSNDSEIAIGLAPEGKNVDAAAVGNEDIAPTGVVFVRPVQNYQAINLPAMIVGDRIGLWVQRTITPGASGYPDDYTRLTVEASLA